MKNPSENQIKVGKSQFELEIPIEEVQDPRHLPREEQDVIKRMVMAHKAGIIDAIPDDPTARAYYNGWVFNKIRQDISEPGYEWDMVKTPPKFERILIKYSNFLEVVNVANFKLALQAAKELDPKIKLPENAHEQIFEELKKLSPERITELCSVMEQPTLIIVPSNTFGEKIKQINTKIHFKGQTNTSVNRLGFGRFTKNVRNRKIKIYIIDGRPQPRFYNDCLDLEPRRKFETERIGQKKLQLVGPQAYAVLMQRSLIEAEQSMDVRDIIDLWERRGYGSFTILNPDELSEPYLVAYAGFDWDKSCVFFHAQPPATDWNIVQKNGRASMEVLEF